MGSGAKVSIFWVEFLKVFFFLISISVLSRIKKNAKCAPLFLGCTTVKKTTTTNIHICGIAAIVRSRIIYFGDGKL